MSNIVVNKVVADSWFRSNGTENYAVRAFVNFSGYDTSLIRGAGNVSSVTDLGVGLYQVNFLVALPSRNYAAVSIAGGMDNDTVSRGRDAEVRNLQTTSCTINTWQSANGALTDWDYVPLIVVG